MSLGKQRTDCAEHLLGAALPHLADAISVHPSCPILAVPYLPAALAVGLKFLPQHVFSPSFKLGSRILAGWNPVTPIPSLRLPLAAQNPSTSPSPGLSPPSTYTLPSFLSGGVVHAGRREA